MVSNSIMTGQHLVSQTFTFEFRDFSVAYRNPEHDQNMCSSCWFGCIWFAFVSQIEMNYSMDYQDEMEDRIRLYTDCK